MLPPNPKPLDSAACTGALTEAGIPVVVPVDERGRFTSEVAPWEGQNVLEANKPIIRALKDDGRLVRHETNTHSYPHCCEPTSR